MEDIVNSTYPPSVRVIGSRDDWQSGATTSDEHLHIACVQWSKHMPVPHRCVPSEEINPKADEDVESKPIVVVVLLLDKYCFWGHVGGRDVLSPKVNF